MPMSFQERLDVFRQLPNYAASDYFSSSNTWQRDGSGEVLVEKSSATTSDSEILVVGVVEPGKIFSGPDGNWNARFNSDFSSSKYTMSMVAAEDTVFGPDFAKAAHELRLKEGTIGSTGVWKNLFDDDGGPIRIKFSSPVFEKRDVPIESMKYHGDMYDGHQARVTPNVVPTLDAFSETWPVSAENAAAYAKLKYTHRPLQLPVYDENEVLIPPTLVNSRLPNALVEATFKLKHYRIRKSNPDMLFDSFTAVTQQIVILREAPPKCPSKFQENMALGPKRYTNVIKRPISAIIDQTPTTDKRPRIAPASAVAGPSGARAEDTPSVNSAHALGVISTPAVNVMQSTASPSVSDVMSYSALPGSGESTASPHIVGNPLAQVPTSTSISVAVPADNPVPVVEQTLDTTRTVTGIATFDSNPSMPLSAPTGPGRKTRTKGKERAV